MTETVAQAASRQFGFNPAEKRGFHGRWTRGGGAAKAVEGAGKAVSDAAEARGLKANHPKIKELLHHADTPEIRQAAIHALASGLSVDEIINLIKKTRSAKA